MQVFYCCNTSPNHFIILKSEIHKLFLYPEMNFQSHFDVFYRVKQFREKKHNVQGFIQMYNGAFLHNRGVAEPK